MENVLVDGEWLAMQQPEGFQPIPHDELEAFMGFEYDRMWGMRDQARHMMLSITWKDANKLLSKVVKEKIVAKQVDETFEKRYHKGGYRCNGFFDDTVSGASGPARGFRFSCTVDDVALDGEVRVFKRDTRCYTLVYYTRMELAAENRPVFDKIIASLEVR